jgi:hypothetical protein
MWHAWEEYNTSVGKLEGKRPLERPRRRSGMESKWILGRLARRVWGKFIWVRIGTGGGLL